MTKSAALLGVVNAVLALLLAFGIDVSPEQQAAVTGIVNAILVAAVAWHDPTVPFGDKPTIGG